MILEGQASGVCAHALKRCFFLVEYSTTFCVAIARFLVVKLREAKSKKHFKHFELF